MKNVYVVIAKNSDIHVGNIAARPDIIAQNASA